METFLERLQSATRLEDIQQLIEGLRDTLSVEHAIYHIVGGTGQEYGALTYDKDWVEHYINQQYFRVDPVVTEALRSSSPINWNQLDWSPSAARTLLGEASDNGVGNQGYSIPIRGVGGQMALFSVTSFDSEAAWDRFGDEHLRNLILVGHYIHQHTSKIMGNDRLEDEAHLSPRERDVLMLLSHGSSRAEAAEKLRISQHTLRDYLDAAREKLGAQNTTHAVATAMVRGLLLP
ncbi:MAG: LuxR family transcriptional regulator [Pseudomonadota bacterium]